MNTFLFATIILTLSWLAYKLGTRVGLALAAKDYYTILSRVEKRTGKKILQDMIDEMNIMANE